MLAFAARASPAVRRPTPADEQRDGALFLLYDSRRRLTYLMLFRVGVVSLLLVAELMGAWAAPFEQALSPFVFTLFGLIAATYGLTIVFAIWLRRTAQVERLTVVQVGTDLLLTTVLVLLTGGAESGFVFMYLLVIVGAATVLLGRGALGATACALGLYIAGVAAQRAGLVPLLAGQVVSEPPLRTLLRTVAINLVAFAATGALAARLAVEVKRASERIASQGMRLRDLSALHQDVIRCLTSGLVTLTRDGRVATFNAAAEEITGLVGSEVEGQNIDRQLPSLRPLIDSLGETESLRRGEVELRRPDGSERRLGISISPLVDADGSVLGRIVNFQDLTDLRRMEEAVTRTERLAAVGRLAAGIAHEIRNPLAAISGSIELLAQSGVASDGGARESSELMAIVLREVERLNTLITGLLDFARPRRVELERFDFAAMLAEMLLVFENDKRLGEVQVELDAPAPVWVDGDPAQLRQVVWNLLLNAAEASPRGEPIRVEVEAERSSETGRWARLTVRDRGPGISLEHRARVFEPFFSTKDGGTGLGLATVHRIVEEHRGAVELEPSPAGGTAVTVRLPLAG